MLEGLALVFESDDLALKRIHRDVDAEPRFSSPRPRSHGHDHLTAGYLTISQDHTVHIAAAALQTLDVAGTDG